jgi:hypothetical protein
MGLTREKYAVGKDRELVEEGEGKLHLPSQSAAPTSAFGQARTRIPYQAPERPETYGRGDSMAYTCPHLTCLANAKLGASRPLKRGMW